MKRAGIVLNGLLIVGAIGAAVLGSEGRATAILQQPPAELAQLEATVATAPTPENLQLLSKTYLDHGQSGLAQALLDRHAKVQTPELTNARARVALAQGRASEALALSRLSLAECDQPGVRCAPWVMGKSLRQVAYLEAILEAGIDDPQQDPYRTSSALLHSTREVRLAHN